MSMVFSAILCWLVAWQKAEWVNPLLLVLLAALVVAAMVFTRTIKPVLAFLLPTLLGLALLGVGTLFAKFPNPSLQGTIFEPLQTLRDAARNSVAGIDQDSRALTLGLAIGDDSLVDQALLEDMKLTSLTHLTAVSGSNCAIVVAASFLLLRRFSVTSRVLISLGVLSLYVLLVGPQPSVLRAATMAAIVLLGYASGRKTAPMNSLALAVLILIVIEPAIASEFAFALSVFATAGILWLAPAIYQKLQSRLPKILALALSVSAAAQIMCFPILLQLQSGLPTYALLANLLAQPFVAPVTILALIAVLVAFVPWLASAIFWLASIPAWFIAQTAHFFAALPLATSFWPVGILGTVLAIILVIAVATGLLTSSVGTRRLAVGAAILVSALTVATAVNGLVRLSHFPVAGWSVASCDVGQGDATVVQSMGQVALIDVGRSESKITRCLRQLQIDEIDLLVLTHFDQDHVGAIEAVTGNFKVQSAMVSPFQDDRPAAKVAQQALQYSNSKVFFAERNQQGQLGAVTWRVLSPERNASESEDSNDASIAMIFDFESFNLVTMADLGEKGQMRLVENMHSAIDAEIRSEPLILKVAHHGSADQFGELIEHWKPAIALLSVGKNNGYGHPTARTLRLLARQNALICRTDQLGSVTVAKPSAQFLIANSADG